MRTTETEVMNNQTMLGPVCVVSIALDVGVFDHKRNVVDKDQKQERFQDILPCGTPERTGRGSDLV